MEKGSPSNCLIFSYTISLWLNRSCHTAAVGSIRPRMPRQSGRPHIAAKRLMLLQRKRTGDQFARSLLTIIVNIEHYIRTVRIFKSLFRFDRLTQSL